MKIQRLSWTTFRLPFRQRFANAYGEMPVREGLLLQLVTDAGISGWGEASPLPEFGGGTLAEALALMSSTAPRLLGVSLDALDEYLDGVPRDRPGWSAVRCAFDTASYDAAAREAGTNVARYLHPSAVDSVPVNATIGSASTTDACTAAQSARLSGFSAVKLKVGLAGSIEEECERVAAVRGILGPDIKLRLDANGAWSVEQAIATICALERYHIEYVEQPAPPGDLRAMRQVREAVNTPIAADEDVTSLESAQQVIECDAADVLVIKPMMVGGLKLGRRIIEMAANARVDVVVTTTIDAGVATAAALHLAATLPQGSPACGLATGDLLVDDLIVYPLEARGGHISVPSGPGLGVTVDAQQLAAFSALAGEAS